MEFKMLCNELTRMCESYTAKDQRHGCPIRTRVDYCVNCERWCIENPEISEKIISDWVELHPRKTMLDVVLEKFPNIKMFSSGCPVTCPVTLELSWKSDNCSGGAYYCSGAADCYNCWRRPVPEE